MTAGGSPLLAEQILRSFQQLMEHLQIRLLRSSMGAPGAAAEPLALEPSIISWVPIMFFYIDPPE